MTADVPGTPEGDGSHRNRATISERAARRDSLEASGADRYDSLFRHLTAGRELPAVRGAGLGARWHPVARQLLALFLVVAGVYAAFTVASEVVREFRVDTWSGPGTAVTSGQRLDDCPAFVRNGDAVFPNWIRVDGRVFHHLGAQLPVGESNIGKYYVDAGYTLGDLRIYRVTTEGLGELGTRILVRSGLAPAGGLYGAIPGCS
jgi:hypothetical protein